MFAIATRNLLLHWRRNALLGIGLSAVCALSILLTLSAMSAHKILTSAGVALRTGHVLVTGYRRTIAAEPHLLLDAPEPVIQVLQKVSGFRGATLRLEREVTAVAGMASEGLTVLATDLERAPALERVLSLVAGDLATVRAGRGILLFASDAKRLGVSIGDGLTLVGSTIRGWTNSQDVVVGAIAQDIGLLSEGLTFIAPERFRALFLLNEGTWSAVQVWLEDPGLAVQFEQEARAALQSAGMEIIASYPRDREGRVLALGRTEWSGQRLDLVTWERELEDMLSLLMAVEAVGIVVLALLIILIGTGLFNTFVVVVEERTPELGTMRALGYHRTQVASLMLMEATLLGLFAIVAGTIAAAGTCAWLNAAKLSVPSGLRMILLQSELFLPMDPAAFLWPCALLLLAVAVTAAGPAIRASRIPPAAAMNTAL